ncbi:MAG TPA: flavodoxin family protein [Syntrophorhabdaceae bacterium]|jgi:putative NADPH-quinone reductase
MEVTILNGSPRGAGGVTGALLGSLTEGLTQGGSRVERFEVAAMKIAACTGCLSCMHKTRGECVIKDDMTAIYERVKATDLLVIGTPVYTHNMTAQMKAVMDRFVCSMQPFLQKDGSGRMSHTHWWPMPPKYLLVSTAGMPDHDIFAPLIATFRAQAVNAGSDPVAEICVAGSLVFQIEPSKIEPHRVMLRELGLTLAQSGVVDPTLVEKLNGPAFTMAEYMSSAQTYEAWCRRKLGMAGE